MISLLLLEKIAQLFLGLLFGFVLVKTKVLHTDDSRVLSYRGIWKVAFLRLLVFPLVMLAIIKALGVSAWVANGETVLMISFLAMAAPSAATVTQQALLFGEEGHYSGAIYTVTTLLCIITMPLMILLYQL